MRGWFDAGRTLLGTMVLGGLLSGCAAQHDEALRLSEELGRAQANAAAQQARAAALESRVSRIEGAALFANSRQSENRELLNRLDRLVALNEKLIAERATPPSAAFAPGTPTSAAPSPAPIAEVASATLSDEEQLRALVIKMRGREGRLHDGLTREQDAALRVLTQPERKLDTEAFLPAIY